MRAQGNQLSQITSLIDSGIIRPVMDKIFPFEQTNEAMAYVESGRAKGKIVISRSTYLQMVRTLYFRHDQSCGEM